MKSANAAKLLLAQIDWMRVYTGLRKFSRTIAQQESYVFDAVSPDDLVGEAILAFYRDEALLGWDPAQKDALAFLCGVVKNKYLDHARRSKRYVDSPAALIVLEPPNQGMADDKDPSSTGDQLRKAARGDKALEELIDAVERIEGMSRLNQELSDLLQTTVADVINRRKRLQRRLYAWPKSRK